MPESILDHGQEIKAGSKPALPGLREFLAIEAWTKRDIPPADRLLGDLVTTTSRMFLVGSTGLGKTLLALGMACGMASGRGFLHWRADRAARVLYIDGEMPEELIRARSVDALRRLDGSRPKGNLLIYARDSEDEFARRFPALPPFAPLNTPQGKHFVLELIGAVGGVDAVVFDNVMSLVNGDQKDEVPWSDTLPLVAQLTKQKIAQIWADHTGHDKAKQYGSSTKAWRFDAVGLMAALPDDQRSGHEVAFTLSFESPGKARRRTPDNWRDFQTCVVRLNDDRWTSEAAGGAGHLASVKLKPSVRPLYDALLDALAVSEIPGRTTKDAWFSEAARSGAVEAIVAEDDYKSRERKRQPLRKAIFELKSANIIGINGEEVFDLRKR